MTKIKNKLINDWYEESENNPKRLWFALGIGIGSIGYAIILWSAVLIRG